MALCFAFILIAFFGTYGAAMDSSDQEASQFSNFLAPEYTPPVAKGIFADVPVELLGIRLGRATLSGWNYERMHHESFVVLPRILCNSR